jgi:TM2 domain-containing membrane protein YozV
MNCPQCQTDNPADSRFCGKCGFPLTGVPPVTTSRPAGAEKKLAAGICGILLGAFGVHKFILGYTLEGVIFILVTVCSFFMLSIVTAVIGIIEGIIYLTKSDEEFVNTYVVNKKKWF